VLGRAWRLGQPRETRERALRSAASWAPGPARSSAPTWTARRNAIDRQERRDRDSQQAVATADAQAQQQRMGLTDVVHLAQQGHDDQVIINQIRSSGSTFQLAPSDLDYLKNSGVSARVIAEMQAARGPLATRVVAPRTTTVIYEPVYAPSPVFIGPAYCRPRPHIFIGGHFHPHCH
jgi:hypothetical protein